MKTRLHRLADEFGQSPWLDNLQRGYLSSGKLQSLVDLGVRGLTSNPTIFQKAIQGSTDYDDQFKEEISRGLTTLDAYWSLVLRDIHGALDIFSPLYDSSHGLDGYVSVEVDPRLAKDGTETLRQARELDDRISRPNVMIKIPATSEGLPAIRAMIADGRNVNVTLIFSLERYSEVIEAYISGLEDRASQNLPLDAVASVASFFISRVDSEIDKRLNALGDNRAMSLLGTAAINQARLAYAIFSEKFSGERWKRLAQLGASVQRPLWASTSTKNAAYKDTLYVDELIGVHTVNTLPDATLDAFVDHGALADRITHDLSAATSQWNQLSEAGVDIADVALQLEREGVQSFIASFEDLLVALEEKRTILS